jgi:hypothetical protein
MAFRAAIQAGISELTRLNNRDKPLNERTVRRGPNGVGRFRAACVIRQIAIQ